MYGPVKPDEPILFLDIDGVLNDHKFSEHAESTTLLPRCIAELNRILKETGAKMVIISAWRYMITGGSMTLAGFDYLLRTHGVVARRLHSLTPPDEVGSSVRGVKVEEWRRQYRHSGPYCILDDGDPMDYGFLGLDHVRPDSSVGLMPEEADRVIQFLKGGR